MPRVKRGVMHTKRRKNLLKKTKGYGAGRRNLIKAAKTAINKAGQHSLRDRRAKKRNARKLWLVQINAALREREWTYSKFIAALKKANIEIDRKILSDLARNNPGVFDKILEAVK